MNLSQWPQQCRLHKTVGVRVGHVQVGGGAPVVVQSMTMTDTADAAATAQQCIELAEAGLGDGARHRQPARGGRGGARDQAADARRRLHGAAHRRLPLQRPPAADAVSRTARAALDKYRINPGNVGTGRRRDEQFATICKVAHRPRQAGAHRRQRRLAQPGAGRSPRCRRTPTAISAGRRRRSSTSAW